MYRKRLLFILLMSFGLFAYVSLVNAGDTTFTISPDGQVVTGTQLTLHCKADEGTTRYEISGSLRSTDSFNEFGGPDNTGYVKTEEWGVGTLTITCAIRHSNNDWNSAERHTKTIQVLPAPAGQSSQKSGGVDFNGYCKYKGYDRAGGNPQNAYTANCAGGDQEVGIDMFDLCAWQYGGVLPYPGLSDRSNLSSWTCNTQSSYVAPPFANNSGSSENSNTVGSSSNNNSSGSSQPKYLPSEARQGSSGVNLAVYCDGLGYGQPNNPSNDSDWSCGSWKVDWNKVCLDVWGVAAWHNINGHDKYGIVCGVGNSSQSSASSSNSSGQANSGSNTDVPIPHESGAACQAPEPVGVGSTARVTPGNPNILRDSPAGNKLGKIPGGGVFIVIGGSVCANGYRWWQVNYNGTIGWTADGDDNEYWIEVTSLSNQVGEGSANGQCLAIAEIRFLNNPDTIIEHNWQLRVFLASPHKLDNGFRVYYRGQDVTDEIGNLDSAGVPGDNYADFWVSTHWALPHNMFDMNNRSRYVWSVVYNC